MSDYLLAPRQSVTKQKTLTHFESRANAPWISARKRRRNLKNCSELSEPVETVQLLWEGKKKVLVLPPEIGHASTPKWMTGPFLISTKSSLVVLYFPSHFPTDRSLKLLGLALLYLGLNTFLHFLKRAPNYVVLVFKLLIKITYLIYFSIFLHRFNKRWPFKFMSKSTLCNIR